MGIRLSHFQTQRVVEKLSSGHDKLLKELKANLEVQQACSLTPTVASSSLSIPVEQTLEPITLCFTGKPFFT